MCVVLGVELMWGVGPLLTPNQADPLSHSDTARAPVRSNHGLAVPLSLCAPQDRDQAPVRLCTPNLSWVLSVGLLIPTSSWQERGFLQCHERGIF